MAAGLTSLVCEPARSNFCAFRRAATSTLLHKLALLRHKEGDITNAVILCERAVGIREKKFGPEHLDVAALLTDLAQLYSDKGDYPRADALFQRALTFREQALGPEHPDVAKVLQGLSTVCAEMGDYSRAELLGRRALSIRESMVGPEHPDVAICLMGLADLSRRAKADYGAAESLLQNALSILEKTLGPEHPHVGVCLGGWARLCRERGDYGRAEALCRRALAIHQKSLGPQHAYVANMLGDLAWLCNEKGDYASAEPLYQRALAIWEMVQGPESPDVAAMIGNLATVYIAKGDLANAERCCTRALSIAERAWGISHPHVAALLNNLADLCRVRHDLESAEVLHRRALAIYEEVLGKEHSGVAISLDNLAGLLIDKGDPINAESLCDRALRIRENALGADHPAVANSLNTLACLLSRKGDYVNAESRYQHALSIFEKALGPLHPKVATSLTNLAQLYLDEGNIMKAVQCAKDAARIHDHNAAVLLTTGSDAQKQAYLATLRNATNMVISIHAQFAPGSREATQLALTTILNRKGRALTAMTDSFAALRHRLIAADQERLNRLRSVCAQYSALVWRGPADTPIPQYRTTLANLNEERQNLEADVSRRGGEVLGALLPTTIEEVRAAIPRGAALVELFRYWPYNVQTNSLDEPRYAAYILHCDGDVAWTDLGEAALIDATILELLATFRSPSGGPKQLSREFNEISEISIADHQQPARTLYALLVQPISLLLRSAIRIVLSPDGLLNLVPFGALLDENERYLIERYELSYLTSGRDLLRFAREFESRQGPVVVAAPDYNYVTPASEHAIDPRIDTEILEDLQNIWFRPLHFAAREGDAIAEIFPDSTLYTGASATKATITMLAGPRLLHIATHGFFLSGQPAECVPSLSEFGAGMRMLGEPKAPMLHMANPLLRSGIALAGANRRRKDEDDGILTALQVSQLDLAGTQLVVLSACETGVGAIHDGDGVYGLRRAMVMAGAETQVMSLWSVDDAATSELMTGYYNRLVAGVGRAEALRLAQIDMLRRPDYSHPYYWAGFIASGKDAPLVAKS